MAVDLFLIEGERDAPVEFRAWRQAQAEHKAVFEKAMKAIEEHGDTSSEYLALDAQGVALCRFHSKWTPVPVFRGQLTTPLGHLASSATGHKQPFRESALHA